MAWKFPRLTRRAFLQTTGAGAAGLGLLQPLELLGRDAAPAADAGESHSYSICNFCSSLCNIRVTIREQDGVKRIVKLDGNPHSTLNRGKICSRGQSGLRQTYDSDRIKTPLIRIEGSRRGENAFRSATWEEAWAYIERRTREADIRPWEWTLVGGWTSCIFYMNWAVPFAMANGIPNIIASPMQHCVATGHLGTDTVTGNFNIHDEVLPDYDNARYILLVANNASIGAVSTCRMVRFAQGKKNGARVVALDSRLSETAAKADEWVAIRPGTDLDFLLAMLREMLVKGYYDEQFVRLHSNLPFLMQRDAGGQWRLALDAEGRPQVVQEGTDRVRSVPAFSNSNERDSEGEAFYPALAAPAGLTLDGRPALTVLQAQVEEIDHCTPEWAERTTGVAAEVIRRIAREFGTTRPAIVDPGWHGARYGNLMMLRRVQAMIQGLTGGIDKAGGWIMSGEFHHKAARMFEARAAGRDPGPAFAALAGLPFAHTVIEALSKGENFPHGRPGWAWAWSAQQKAADEEWVALPVLADVGLKESVEGKVEWKGEPYRTRAIMLNAANPVRHYYPDTRWKEVLGHENMELVIAIDVLPSDTAAWADVILPNSTYLERDEPTLYGNGVNHDLALTTRYAAIDPLFDTEEIPDILLEMTRILSGDPDRLLEWVEAMTGMPAAPVRAAWERLRAEGAPSPFTHACREVSFRLSAERAGTTSAELDRVLRERGIFTEQPREQVLEHAAMPRRLPLPTGSGRVEYYSSLFDSLRGMGAEGPHFSVLATHIPARCRDNADMAAPLGADEFYFTYGKTPTVSYASTNSNNPVLAAVNRFKGGTYTGIWIHPDRAARLDIVTGDPIRLTNTRSGQTATGHAYITRLVHRDALFIYSSFGAENPALSRSHGLGTATNKLVPYRVEPVVGGFRSQEFTLRVQKLDNSGGAA